MPATLIKVSDFNWTATYYQEILDSLVAWKRTNCPELTDESEHDLVMQLLAAFALVGHMNNVRVDLAAVESMLRTAKLPSSVRELLRLIGYEMRGASPAKCEILYTLVAPLTGPTTIVPEGAWCTTNETAESDAVNFEADEAITGDQTEVFDYVFADESGTFTDYSTEAQTDVDFTPWTTPTVGDALYFGSATCMWDAMAITKAASLQDASGVWEVYDGVFAKSQPDAVVINGGQLEFDLNGYLGTTNRTGTVVRIQVNSTRDFEDVESFWDGATNKVLTSYLGQVAPSTDATSYTVGSDWQELSELENANTLSNTQDLVLSYELPQTASRRWVKTTVNGETAFWLRFRIVAVGGAPSSPTISSVDLTTGEQYAIGTVTQGLTQIDQLGNGTGEPNQRFELSRDFFIMGTEEFAVNGIAWTRVANFVNSGPQDEHYMVQLGDDDRATIVCGPIGHGKAPPAGINNVAAAYRYGADVDGNVGAGTLTVDRAGLTRVQAITNPRKAVGWSEAQGASEASLERAKQLGPATLRVPGEVAISPDDVVTFALNMQDDNGSSPFSRAWAVEEMFGPKTIGLIVVGAGGGAIPEATLSETDTWFNGDKFAVPPKPKRVVANTEVTTVNYTAKAINVHAQLTATTGYVISQAELDAIEASLTALLDPEATIDSGYAWAFGDEIAQSRILHEIHRIASFKIAKVVLVGWVDVALGASELPVAGTITIEAA